MPSLTLLMSSYCEVEAFAARVQQVARHATPRHATPRHATPRHATPRRLLDAERGAVAAPEAATGRGAATGGRGEIVGTESASLCTDVPCRGFWSYYAELMGMEVAGGIR